MVRSSETPLAKSFAGATRPAARRRQATVRSDSIFSDCTGTPTGSQARAGFFVFLVDLRRAEVRARETMEAVASKQWSVKERIELGAEMVGAFGGVARFHCQSAGASFIVGKACRLVLF